MATYEYLKTFDNTLYVMCTLHIKEKKGTEYLVEKNKCEKHIMNKKVYKKYKFIL